VALAVIVGGAVLIFGVLASMGSGANSSDAEFESDDQQEGNDYGFEVNARLRIKYIDADGDASEREIQAYRYTDSSPGYVKARCLKAKANRTFRTDRIRDAVDMETGEIIKRIPTFMRSKRVD
jgi:hypothetical protein